jgi:hypothetical protein
VELLNSDLANIVVKLRKGKPTDGSDSEEDEDEDEDDIEKGEDVKAQETLR